MSIDHGKVLAMADGVKQHITWREKGVGCVPSLAEMREWEAAFRALAQPAEAAEDITDLVMQPGAACPTCKQFLHVQPAEAVVGGDGLIALAKLIREEFAKIRTHLSRINAQQPAEAVEDAGNWVRVGSHFYRLRDGGEDDELAVLAADGSRDPTACGERANYYMRRIADHTHDAAQGAVAPFAYGADLTPGDYDMEHSVWLLRPGESVPAGCTPLYTHPQAAHALMSSQDDWTVLDCPHCGKCVTYSKKAASSKDAYRDLTQEVESLRERLGQAALAQPAEAREYCPCMKEDCPKCYAIQPAEAVEGERRFLQAMEDANAREIGETDAAQGAVAWRFWMDESESWLKPGWSEWSADSKFRLLCDSLGYRAEFAYPATHPQAAPAQGGLALPDSRLDAALDLLCGLTGEHRQRITDDVRMDHLCDTARQIAALAAPAQGDGWRLCYSAVIHALAAIVSVRCQDKLFDLDAIPRGPVMDQVVLIREAMDRFGKTRAAAPSQEGE